ncbi:MAG: hypothetical protein PHD21_00440 [Flavobacteriales bacterium]|nr:hypothetical protein [Flavobacteriales bacterium]
MDIFVTIGVYQDKDDAPEVFEIKVPALPRVGDKILLNSEMRDEAEKMCKLWGFPQGTELNYVRCVAYQEDALYPIVMLSFNHLIFKVINIITPENESISMLVRDIPKQGDNIFLPDKRVFRVQDFTYDTNGNIFCTLADDEHYEYPQRFVRGSVDAKIFNKVPVEIVNK